MKKKTVLITFVCLICVAAMAQQPQQQSQSQPQPQRRRPQIDYNARYAVKDIGIHDPVMAKEGSTYYLFATGGGLSVMSSNDGMETWKFEKPIFEERVASVRDRIPGWAPDIIYHNGMWHIFYAVSAFGKNTSIIGHATNKTLDSSNPDFKWEDQPKIIESIPYRDMWNAIDPNLIVDEDGTPWMSFGSFWDGIKLFKMTNDMSAVAEPQEWRSICSRQRDFNLDDANPGDGAVEAPFIMKHGDYYYLFVSFDYCCRGKNSNYKVAVGRSQKVTGPYLDKEGKDMAHGGGSIIIEGNQDWAGIGHNSAYHFDGKDYFIAHAYSMADNGASKLVIREITWTADGWPVVEW
ncbi:MAG: arabinan endo-1,5-alpha-L-arabinosidase [Candidatus Cryptobacteroides sp.]|jgi:arabinan endo-1,5-alpha-L-arabinosidase